MDESQDVHGCFVDDGYVTCTKENDEVLEVDEEAVIDELWELLLLLVDFLGVYLSWLNRVFEAGCGAGATWFAVALLFYLGGHVENFIDDLEQMVAAPFLIVFHYILENSVHLIYNVHLHQIHELNFSRVNYRTDNFNCEGVELRMVDFKILEKDFNQLELVQNHNKSRIALDDDRQQLKTK